MSLWHRKLLSFLSQAPAHDAEAQHIIENVDGTVIEVDLKKTRYPYALEDRLLKPKFRLKLSFSFTCHHGIFTRQAAGVVSAKTVGICHFPAPGLIAAWFLFQRLRIEDFWHTEVEDKACVFLSWGSPSLVTVEDSYQSSQIAPLSIKVLFRSYCGFPFDERTVKSAVIALRQQSAGQSDEAMSKGLDLLFLSAEDQR